ncbi:MAG: diaminopimelate epimerase [Candidatus Edwardsbacteria bacterium]|nr:diaminopimelate epimerase [Candidatus Edwardsbacteria bacterium]
MNFYKMSGSGNDFVLLDNRAGQLPGDLSPLVQRLCHRRNGVGADGVLVIERSAQADFRMRYLNADGGEAAFCGNGGRCIAWFAHSIGAVGKSMTFQAGDGLHRAEVNADRVKLQMREPRDFDLRFLLDLDDRGYSASFADTGVPHVVIPVAELDDFPVAEAGRKIRHHDRFQPAGTNANFIEIADRHHLKIRTYERGVEDETLACGTGATAAAVVAARLGMAESPVECLTRGGETLTIHFQLEGEAVSQVFLEGRVQMVFQGEILSS